MLNKIYDVTTGEFSTDTIEPIPKVKEADLRPRSAYQIAVDNGFEGTEAEWLETLKGSGGTASFELAPATLTALAGNGEVTLTIRDPNDRVVKDTDGHKLTLAKWAKTRVVRKLGSYPAHQADGDTVLEYSERNKHSVYGFVDINVVNEKEYFYMAFPCSEDGVWTVGIESGAAVSPTSAVRYGFRIDRNDPNPDTRVEYLYDAVGFEPAYMDYTTGEFNYGSWRQFCEEINTPVMLSYDGTVAYELDRNDQTLKADGTLSDIANPHFEGNAMSQFKRWWLKQYQDEDYSYVIFSNVQIDETYKADAFTDKDGIVRDFMYKAMFEGSYTAPRLRSLATGTVMASTSGQVEIARAEENGAGWHIQYKSQRDFITYLLWLISKSTADQAKFGNGNSDSGTFLTPGTLKSAGQFKGFDTTTQAVKVFYVENFWGNYWKRMSGQLLDLDGQVYTKLTPPYQQPALPDENEMPDGYMATGVVPSGASGGYVNRVSVSDNGLVQARTGGSLTTFYTAGMWHDSGGTIKWARVGGLRGAGGLCGACVVLLNTPLSNANSNSCASLSFLENASS